MKPVIAILAVFVGIALGIFIGFTFERERESTRLRLAVAVGPYSDNYDPARADIAEAIRKLKSGDTNVLQHLTAADEQIKRCQEWTAWFLKSY